MSDRTPFTVPLPKKGAEALFSVAPSLAVGSPYVDPHKVLAKKHVKVSSDRPLFKPPGTVHFPDPFPTLYATTTATTTAGATAVNGVESNKKKEIVVVRGVYVNRANEAFEKFPEYVSESEEAKFKERREALKKEQETRKDQAPFRLSAPALAPFTKASDLYYSLVPRGGVPKTRTVPKKPDEIVAAFRPPGNCPPFSKFQEYISEPEKQTQRKEAKKEGEMAWRPSDAAVKTKTAPSVAYHILNLRKESTYPHH